MNTQLMKVSDYRLRILREHAEFLQALIAIDAILVDYEKQQGWVDTIELLQKVQDMIPSAIRDTQTAR